MDGLVECGDVCEGLVGEVMGLESRQTGSMSLSSGAYFGSHSTVSQCARAARAANERLLVWIGPLPSTISPDQEAERGGIAAPQHGHVICGNAVISAAALQDGGTEARLRDSGPDSLRLRLSAASASGRARSPGRAAMRPAAASRLGLMRLVAAQGHRRSRPGGVGPAGRPAPHPAGRSRPGSPPCVLALAQLFQPQDHCLDLGERIGLGRCGRVCFGAVSHRARRS